MSTGNHLSPADLGWAIWQAAEKHRDKDFVSRKNGRAVFHQRIARRLADTWAEDEDMRNFSHPELVRIFDAASRAAIAFEDVLRPARLLDGSVEVFSLLSPPAVEETRAQSRGRGRDRTRSSSPDIEWISVPVAMEDEATSAAASASSSAATTAAMSAATSATFYPPPLSPSGSPQRKRPTPVRAPIRRARGRR